MSRMTGLSLLVSLSRTIWRTMKRVLSINDIFPDERFYVGASVTSTPYLLGTLESRNTRGSSSGTYDCTRDRAQSLMSTSYSRSTIPNRITPRNQFPSSASIALASIKSARQQQALLPAKRARQQPSLPKATQSLQFKLSPRRRHNLSPPPTTRMAWPLHHPPSPQEQLPRACSGCPPLARRYLSPPLPVRELGTTDSA